MQDHYLFVYGTLLNNANNPFSDYLSNNSQLIDSGYFLGKLFRISWYPGAIRSDVETDKVHGSVFKLFNINTVLKELDAYEGIAEGLYKRELLNVVLRDDLQLKCWVYIYNQPITHFRRIPSGHFLKP